MSICWHQGRKSLSLIGTLRESNFLASDYSVKAQKLYDYYFPFESDSGLCLAAKKSLMAEWWHKHFDLLISSGLRMADINSVIDQRLSTLREGVPEFISLLAKHKIPLVVFSASGFGVTGLKYFFSRNGLLSDNIHFIANDFVWADDGRAQSVKEPIIHSFNKDETMLADFNCYDAIKNRTNVLLFGDSLGDARMTDGFPCQTLLKIGFLNDRILESLPIYRDSYQALVLNDGDFDLPLSLLKEIISYAD